MYVLEDGNVKAECVVTDEDNGILENSKILQLILRIKDRAMGKH